MEPQSSLFNFEDDSADELEQGQDPDLFAKAVLWSTDWTVKTIIQQIEDCNIDLSPGFQRRDAWSSRNKNRYLESVALQIPIPQIVLAEKADQRGTYIVLDGKQRLLTLAQFAAKLDDDHPVKKASKNQKPIKLSGLDILSILNGKTYADICGDVAHKRWRTAFDNHSIRCSVIRAWPNENYLYEVFIRLNTGSSKLSPQELRQAMRPGKFTEFIARRSGESLPLQSLLGISVPDFRMRDADLLLRLIAFSTRANEYDGNMKGFLDATHDVFNKSWDDREAEIYHVSDEIDNAVRFLIENMGGPENVGRRWNGQAFEKPVNRAVLDVQISSTLNSATREEIEKKNIVLTNVIKELCEENRAFNDSITGTTKSLKAVHTRFGEWRSALENALSTSLIK